MSVTSVDPGAPLSPQNTDAAVSRPLTAASARAGVQRRRREVALTARWLRELRGTGDARPAGRFTRPVKH